MDSIRRNAEAFHMRTGKPLCAVVKANAYGHGAEEVVNALNGVADCFAVALIEEGKEILTAACGKDILVFTPPTDEEECYALASCNLLASVGDLRTAKLLSSVCRRYGLSVRVHLKVNTGMNRYGMDVSDLERVCQFLSKDSFVKVTGIYSHLCECSLARAKKQRELFLKAQDICKGYFPEANAHLSATYGALLGQAFAFDMVRVGIGLYGYLPCKPSKKSGVQQIPALEKGMQVYAKRILTRRFSFGGAGYGKELSVKQNTPFSVYRVGYADGFLRKKKNGLLGADKNAGNACMDACIREDKGKRGEWALVLENADTTAKKTGTISYEVLCAATRRAEHLYP